MDFTHLIGSWGYPGIFLVVVLGNIGLPVPEESVLALAGYLVWAGQLHVLPVLVVAIVSAVAAARFVGGLRFLAGPLAGAMRLPLRSFLLGNFLGAVLFVPYAVGIGYAIGYGLGPYVARVQHVVAALVIVAVILALLSVAFRLARPAAEQPSPPAVS